MKWAVSKFKRVLQNCVIEPEVVSDNDNDQSYRPKQLYLSIKNKLFIPPKSESYWSKRFTQEIHYNTTYITKIKLIREKKLSEFNYKLLNRILPCRNILMKWGKVQDNKCQFCGEVETVEHMLFLCADVKEIWNIFLLQNKLKFDMAYLIFGNDNLPLQWAITVIQYVIFKRWVLKQNNKDVFNFRLFIRKELEYRCSVYKINGYNEVIRILNNFAKVMNYVVLCK